MESLHNTTRPVVLGVSTYQLAGLIEEVGSSLRAEAQVGVLQAHFEEAVTQIERRQQHAPCDVIVSAGSNAQYLRSRLSIPVVSVRVDGHDIIAAITKARAISNRIAVVLHHDTGHQMARFAAAFDLPIVFRDYEVAEDAHLIVKELRRAGVEVVVGAGVVVQAAAALGVASVFLYSAASVRVAMDEAISLANAKAFERSRYALLNSVLQHLDDGVVALDVSGKLMAANTAAGKLLNMSFETPTDAPLELPFESFSTLEHASAAKLRASHGVEDIGGRTVIIDRAPLYDHDVHIGAVLTIRQPIHVERAFHKLRSHRHKQSKVARYRLDDVVGLSPSMADVVTGCRIAAEKSDATVLITGPTGVGKEMIAQGMHNASPRSRQPFLAINCGALPETLLESELFGYEEGAFTGARRGGKAGLFEAAHGGTVFLDEIAEMPSHLQTRLLRVLQEREVTRLGSSDSVQVDVRIFAATHRDLWERVLAGAFRQDLFYRISVLRVSVPPLRERPEDRDHLGTLLLARALKRARLENLTPSVVPIAMHAVRSHDWPGNVRELENFAERVALACLRGSESISADQFSILLDRNPADMDDSLDMPTKDSRDLAQTTASAVRRALDECGGNRTLAAKRLGIARSTLWRLLKA